MTASLEASLSAVPMVTQLSFHHRSKEREPPGTADSVELLNPPKPSYTALGWGWEWGDVLMISHAMVIRPLISHSCKEDGTEYAGFSPNQDRNRRTRSARDAEEGRGAAGAHFGAGDVVR